MSVTAIVLAGGRSRRFGSDKLAADLGGESVLAAAIRAVAPLADAVIIAGHDVPAGLPADGPPVTGIEDLEPEAGPLVAIVNVLEHGLPDPGDVALVVGGDMPRLVPSVLVRMLDVLDVDPTVDAVFLGRPEAATAVPPSESPRRQVLPLAIRVQPAARAAREAVQAGRRSLQAFVDALTAVELPPSAWLPLDPSASTLLDVDTPADLDRLR